MEECGPLVGQLVLKTRPRVSDEGSTPCSSAKISELARMYCNSSERDVKPRTFIAG